MPARAEEDLSLAVRRVVIKTGLSEVRDLSATAFADAVRLEFDVGSGARLADHDVARLPLLREEAVASHALTLCELPMLDGGTVGADELRKAVGAILATAVAEPSAEELRVTLAARLNASLDALSGVHAVNVDEAVRLEKEAWFLRQWQSRLFETGPLAKKSCLACVWTANS